MKTSNFYHYFIWFVALLVINTDLCSQKVLIKTSIGKIVVELNGDKAPITTANFLQYVKEGAYNGGTFYRAVRQNNSKPNQSYIEVIQGGIGDTLKRRAPIEIERTSLTGLKHEHGTISMARGTPNSASSEFFICINAQPALDYGGMRNPDGQGFAAFGKVINGMKVVRKIQQKETTLYPALGLPQKIVDPIKIIKMEVIN